MTNPVAISAKTEQNRRSYLAHARRPFVVGPWSEAYAGWRLVYEAKSAIRDQNPLFAASLLPQTGTATIGYPGLTVRPTGVVVEADKVRAGSVTVSVDVAGALTFSVTSPAGLVSTPTVSSTATRSTATFAAADDGLYALTVSLGGALVTTLLIPVQREADFRLREESRTNDGGFAFKANRRPRPTDTFNKRLFLILTKDAAAATGNRLLYAQLDAAERALPSSADTPMPLFPSHV